MVHAWLVCSDGECAALFEAYGAMREVEALGCECGCWLQPLGWPEPVEGRAAGRAVVLTPA